jgi:hypothetical protein
MNNEETKKKRKRKRTCSKICLMSKGNICKCICRGTNHGKGRLKEKGLFFDDNSI